MTSSGTKLTETEKPKKYSKVLYNLSAREAVESIDRDIEYYRKRINWFQLYTVAAIAVAIFYEKRMIFGSDESQNFLFSIFYLVMCVLSNALQYKFYSRIDQLRDSRSILFSKSRLKEIFPILHNRMNSARRIFYFGTWFLAILAVTVTWLDYGESNSIKEPTRKPGYQAGSRSLTGPHR